MREVLYALRRLRGSWPFTAAATVTLALTIGATASVFGLVNSALFKALPFRDPGRLLSVYASNPTVHENIWTTSPADFLDWRAQANDFTGLAAWEYQPLTAIISGQAELARAFAVTPNYLPLMGVSPVIGRTLAVDSSGSAEVVADYNYWQRRLGGTRSVLGRTLTLDSKPYRVVGVVKYPGFGPDLWTRLSFTAADLLNRDARDDVIVVGRLKPGVTQEGAERELKTIAQRLAAAYPKADGGWSVTTRSIIKEMTGFARPQLLTLLAAAGCVLLIGAATLANLFLARWLARAHEMALRTALGATSGRIARELVAEAAVLGIGAGLLGIFVAVGGVAGLRLLVPPGLTHNNPIVVDGRVMLFSVLTGLATVLIFGVLPAWRTSRGSIASSLTLGVRATGSTRERTLQNGLVVLQVAVALVLLTGAGLLVKAFTTFVRMDPGFLPNGVVTAEIDLPVKRYVTADQQADFYNSLVAELSAQPGVQGASLSDALPSFGLSTIPFRVLGASPPGQGAFLGTYGTAITPDYFRTMGIKLLRGRTFLPSDGTHSPMVTVVDERFVRSFLGNGDPIGRRMVLRQPPDTQEIVGVVASVKQNGLASPDLPEAYAPLTQSPASTVWLSVRTAGNPTSAERLLRHAVANLDPTVPVSDVESMTNRMLDTVSLTHFASFLASLFAVVGLVLGAVGIYSVLAYIVSQGRREIAVRIALGAGHRRVMADVLRRALVLTCIGIAAGVVATWWITRALPSLFVGANPHDPGIFVGAAAIFVLVALAAGSVPAFRTTRVNPVVALNST